MANQRFYLDLKLLQKRANQRMVRLEHAEINSPAYQAVQAQLEILGRTAKSAKGRRFSESGKATYNEYEMQKRILTKFLDQTTSTVKGSKIYYNKIYQTANEEYDLEGLGISKSEWGEFWANMPDKKDRMYGSDQLIKTYKAVVRKQGSETDENALTPAEIAQGITDSRNLKEAYTNVGVSWKEVEKEDSAYNDFIRQDD